MNLSLEELKQRNSGSLPEKASPVPPQIVPPIPNPCPLTPQDVNEIFEILIALKAKTVTVPDSVSRRGITQYVAHAAEEFEREVKLGYSEDGEMTFEEFANR